MGRFFDALKVGFKDYKERTGPPAYSIAGRTVRCPHCGEDKFLASTALLNSSVLTLVNLDWLDRSATVLVCAECGRIEWYAQKPEEIRPETRAAPQDTP